MTDDEEFAARSQLNGRGKATPGYCSIAAGEWAGWSRQGPLRHVAISQSRRHPKRHGQSVLVQR